jgi:hypothetical protein
MRSLYPSHLVPPDDISGRLLLCALSAAPAKLAKPIPHEAENSYASEQSYLTTPPREIGAPE